MDLNEWMICATLAWQGAESAKARGYECDPLELFTFLVSDEEPERVESPA